MGGYHGVYVPPGLRVLSVCCWMRDCSSLPGFAEACMHAYIHTYIHALVSGVPQSARFTFFRLDL